MNTANLQLEGLYLAIAAINNALVAKGLMSRQDIHDALRIAEETALSDDRTEALSAAHRDAMAFPARLLQRANNTATDTEIARFSELAKSVGETKEPVNDQR